MEDMPLILFPDQVQAAQCGGPQQVASTGGQRQEDEQGETPGDHELR